MGTGNSSICHHWKGPTCTLNFLLSLYSFKETAFLPPVLANRQRGTRRRDVIRAINPRCSLPDGRHWREGEKEYSRKSLRGISRSFICCCRMNAAADDALEAALRHDKQALVKRAGLKSGPHVVRIFQAEVLGNSRNKIHQTWGPLY